MAAGKLVLTPTAARVRAISLALSGVTLAISGNGVLADYALAEIVPDGTLGNESSVVIPNTTVRGEIADKIEGGATRGANLFHSFQEFNVGELQRVYFANPSGIENILTRVTGGNISNILGTLGVDGSANLFLLNPNGIVFGSQARLDVAGSFFASTANSLVFGDGLEFSATSPQAPPLLTINITPGLQYGKDDPRTTITNRGNLAAGKDLTLAAGNLDLQGQLDAGRNLTLLAEDTVNITDSVAQPFKAYSGGSLLIQGNQLITIAAKNHSDSGLLAGLDLRLRSANPITGDTNYTVGGNIIIEQLDGNPGNFISPNDPIILANGDVSLGNYTGASLHILAGGSVTVGDIEINSTDTGDNAISPSNSNPFLASLANVTLSDEARTSVVIDGSKRPTLDIRAGIDWTLLGGFPGNTDSGNLTPNFGTAATSANIEIGKISINSPNGLVLLTNQYQANPSLVSDTLKISSLLTGDGTDKTNFNTLTSQTFSGNGGEVLIDYRGGIEITERIDASSASGQAGDITLITNDEISLDRSFIRSNTFGTEKGGDITIDTGSLFATDGAQIETSTFGQANAGKITIVADDIVSFDGVARGPETFTDRVTGPVNIIRSGAEGNSGGIFITTGSLFVTGGAQMQVRLGDLRPNEDSMGNSGNIEIFARDQVTFGGIGSAQFGTAITSVEGGGIGDAGDIKIEARSVVLTNGSLQSNTIGKGNAGEVKIFARETVTLDKGPRSILSRVNPGGEGKGGNVFIQTGSLFLTNGAGIISDTEGIGNGGNITIDADQVIFDGIRSDDNPLDCDRAACPSGVFSSVSPRGIGDGGRIEIKTNSISMTNGGSIDASTNGNGIGGPIELTTNKLTVNDGLISSAAGDQATGQAGTITINTDSLKVEDEGIITVTSDKGIAGNLVINANSLLLNNGTLEAKTADNNGELGANITLNISDLIQIKNESLISAEASDGANGGNITIDNNRNDNPNDDPLLIAFPPTSGNGSDIIAKAPMGQGGNIIINAFSVFGDIEERPAFPGNGTNDIDATGNINGDVSLNTTNDFLEREPNSLPTEPGNDQLYQRCQPGNSSGSRFINTGRGGIPPRPGEISSNTLWEDIRRPTARGRYRSRTALVKPPVKPPTTPKPKRIIEAQGLMIDADGNIFLTAYPTTVTPDGSWRLSGECGHR
ncbi:filamentous hemagglutinin N-terminal domain-containing protein [Moorena sp. SIO3I8]|uniref:two-partner secretion domain-containing protein n=1 Tax=Moorena sp. SIO3I8 TaxID=2607833 RepID=UPI0025D205B4|nr:filamentous hemagglutinin N-terminal domain-containing protein [Moorena sp. SIO3I8]